MSETKKYVLKEDGKHFVGEVIAEHLQTLARGFDDASADVMIDRTHPDAVAMSQLESRLAHVVDFIDDISFEMPKEERKKKWDEHCIGALIIAADCLEEVESSYKKTKKKLVTGRYDELMEYNKSAIKQLKGILKHYFGVMSYKCDRSDIFNPVLQVTYREGKNTVKNIEVSSLSSGYFDKNGIIKKEIVNVDKKKENSNKGSKKDDLMA